ncbi:GSCFA domain-containing protein [Nannocystis sp. ILAH1]|uniref:GSCFA domain-containing protein n=1 Tax=unclassified Nannocystis TaxID=2627009 RepID=UPI00226DE1D7|nr:MULTISPECIES: GSCFA domain-containing protein [unclassified Nannocystis]MCY0992213.1 GSCFA domain-containing protein [Nannocystis sp. ILAH1]MCY1069197.1 GSCFA domain-containing protein [Nannocystis sp. RBIL2]
MPQLPEGNPYSGRPKHCFWQQAVAACANDGVDPVVAVPFHITPKDQVAMAGSCFAQHLSHLLVAEGFTPLFTERFIGAPGTLNEGYGVFPARFGNVYTARQLLQLFDRAYGLFRPQDRCWPGPLGFIDPFRPRIQAGGFPSRETLEADRARHFAATRRMFEQSDVFVFTLGLTEYWAAEDGAVFPLAPGVVSPGLDPPGSGPYRFGNAGVAEVVRDIEAFLGRLREVNRRVRVVLTVSPVPLLATFEDRHVLVSTVASKSILRAAVDEICRAHDDIAYFPSFEIITGPQSRGRFHGPDLREVTPEGVGFVQAVFRRHFLDLGAGQAEASVVPAPAPEGDASDPDLAGRARRYATLARVICDEEAIIHPGPAGGATRT